MSASELPPGVADLSARRLRRETAVREVAAAPVRFVPDALLEALQGSWGEPLESSEPLRLTVAR